MQTTTDVAAQLEAARIEANKLQETLAENEATRNELSDRLASTTSRGAFSKLLEDSTWNEHLIELGKKKVEQHRIEVLTPLEIAASQAQSEREAAAVFEARAKTEQAFAHAGELARDAVRAIAAAIESLGAFEQVRIANLTGAGAVSLATLRSSALVSVMNGKIGAEFVKYIQMHAAGGELQLHAPFPITLPQNLR